MKFIINVENSTGRSWHPNGWRLPSGDEWQKLVDIAGGGKADAMLKAKSGWNKNGNGADAYGFSALPGGLGLSDGSFYDVGTTATGGVLARTVATSPSAGSCTTTSSTPSGSSTSSLACSLLGACRTKRLGCFSTLAAAHSEAMGVA